MYCGSIAIALSAPYGEGSSGEVSVMGRSWSSRCPALANHAVIRSRSPISPIPQLRADGIENNGTRVPARRSFDTSVMRGKIPENRSDYRLCSRHDEVSDAANRSARANASAN